jgi:hypothetical protein
VLDTGAQFQGALLPTKKIAMLVNRAAETRLDPVTYWPNPGANLESFARHSRTIDEQLRGARGARGVITGHKKDVVVSNKTGAGREAIYGWYATRPVPGVPLYTDAFGGKYIQPLSDVHDDAYVDYSHGVRAVHPVMIVDGREMVTETVYKNDTLSELVSDEGPIKNPRYDARPFGQSVSPLNLLSSVSGFTRIYVEGLRAGLVLSRMRRYA